MSAPHYMPLYWSDYQGGTTALDCEQHGAYLLLLGKMWQAGGTLPADDVILARLVGLTKARWLKIAPPVMALFTSVEGGITQKRLAAELKILEEKYESRARAGSLGGRAKSLKDKKATVSNASGNATVLPCQLELEPELEERDKESLSERGKDFEAFWAAYPNKVGKAAALKSYKTAARKTDLATMLAAIEAQRRGEKWTRDGGRFIPNPATWLNQERWEDGGTDSPPPPAPGMPGTRWAFV